MKRMRFFSAISLMILCICILGAGVYAANTTDRNMGMTGTIDIPANLIGVQIDGYLGNVVLDGATVKNEKGEVVSPKFEARHTDNPPKSWEFDDEDEVKHLTFNTEEANSIDDIKETITISFVITNTSDLALSIYFGEKEGNGTITPILVDSLNGAIAENTSIVNSYLGTGVLAAGSEAPTRTIVTMRFGLNRLLDDSDSFTFNYTLVVEEAELIDTPYNAVIEKISALEQLSKDYNSTDAQLRVMQYIRATQYSGDAWNAVAGTVEDAFATYVTTNQGDSNVSSLQSLGTIRVPSLVQDIDFRHMIAIMNVYANPNLSSSLEAYSAGLSVALEKTVVATTENVYDLVGWGGDFCQLVAKVKSVIGETSDSELIKSKARELFMGSSSGFSSADLFADMDAVNIAKIYSDQTTKSISTAMSSYYEMLTNAQRKSDFVANATLGASLTVENIVSRLTSNPALEAWCVQNGLSFTTHAAIFNAVASVFADYLAN